MNYYQKFITGTLSLVMLGLIVVGPLYLSEKLEAVETSQSGLVSREEAHESIDTLYQPYLEHNEETRFSWTNDYQSSTPNSIWIIPGYHGYEDNTVYNFDGLHDQTTIATPTFNADADIYISTEIDTQELLENGIYNLGIYAEMPTEACRLLYVMFRGYDTNREYVDGYLVDSSYYPAGSQVGSAGAHIWNITLDDTVYNSAITEMATSTYETLTVIVEITNDMNNEIFYHSVEIESDYYIETTTWNNQTIYEPYIQTITPYSVHKVSMGLGSILILGFGWIASPFNRSLNNFIPINAFSWRKRGRSK